MAEAQARQLFAQLLDGLAYCHAQGVYHRDLRVEHILLSGRYIRLTMSILSRVRRSCERFIWHVLVLPTNRQTHKSISGAASSTQP